MELFKEAEFWVLVGFLAFLVGVGRTGWKLASGALDSRAAKIRSQLAEAARLRAEAQAVLESALAKQKQAAADAADIVAAAKDEAERMRQDAEADLKRALAAREAQAMDRIALAEQAAVQAVRSKAVEIAVRAATDLVQESMDGESAALLVDRSIDTLPLRVQA